MWVLACAFACVRVGTRVCFACVRVDTRVCFACVRVGTRVCLACVRVGTRVWNVIHRNTTRQSVVRFIARACRGISDLPHIHLYISDHSLCCRAISDLTAYPTYAITLPNNIKRIFKILPRYVYGAYSINPAVRVTTTW